MRVLLPLAEGFEEIEAIVVVDVLRRAGVKVELVGIEDNVIRGRNKVSILAEKLINEVKPEDYDGIVLPGGNPGYKNLEKCERLVGMIKKLASEGKVVAAICSSPLILARIGLLKDRKATAYPGLERELPKPSQADVVIDGNIITSKGPGTALNFALEIVKVLLGSEREAELRKALIA